MSFSLKAFLWSLSVGGRVNKMSSIIDSECSERFSRHTHTSYDWFLSCRQACQPPAFCTRSDSLSWLIACDRGLCHNYPGPYHKLMRCIFHVLATGSALTVFAGSQSTEEEKKDWSLTNSRTHAHSDQFKRGEMGECRVKGQRGVKKKNAREGEVRKIVCVWGRGLWRGWAIDSEQRKEKAVLVIFT